MSIPLNHYFKVMRSTMWNSRSKWRLQGYELFISLLGRLCFRRSKSLTWGQAELEMTFNEFYDAYICV